MTDPGPDPLETLLADLAATDGPPPSVVAAAMAAFTWRDVDTELVELLTDSHLADTAGLRAATLDSRLITASVAGVMASIELVDEGLTIRVLGELSGRMASVVVETPIERCAAAVDVDGLFDVVVRRPGPVRVVFQVAGRVLHTTWLSI